MPRKRNQEEGQRIKHIQDSQIIDVRKNVFTDLPTGYRKDKKRLHRAVRKKSKPTRS